MRTTNKKNSHQSSASSRKSTTRSTTNKNTLHNNENEYGVELAPRVTRNKSQRKSTGKKRTSRK